MGVDEEGLLSVNGKSRRDPHEGMYRIGTIFGGIIDDYKRRMPYYADDFSKGFTRKAWVPRQVLGSRCFSGSPPKAWGLEGGP